MKTRIRQEFARVHKGMRNCFIAVCAYVILASSSADAATICHYDSKNARPNPLGMRSYITIISETPRVTRFIYDAFGTGSDAGAAKRELDIASSVAVARKILRTNVRAYSLLLGEAGDMREFIAIWDRGLLCGPASALDMERANDKKRTRLSFK